MSKVLVVTTGKRTFPYLLIHWVGTVGLIAMRRIDVYTRVFPLTSHLHKKSTQRPRIGLILGAGEFSTLKFKSGKLSKLPKRVEHMKIMASELTVF